MLSKIKKPYRSLAFMLGILVIFFAAVFMAAVSVQAAEQSTQVPQKVPGPQAPAAIPLAEVATKATEVSNLLRNMSTQFAPSHEIETIGRQLQEGSVQIDLELSETMKVLRAQPT
jgi:predicted PurR-regulated permease PerM